MNNTILTEIEHDALQKLNVPFLTNVYQLKTMKEKKINRKIMSEIFFLFNNFWLFAHSNPNGLDSFSKVGVL